MNNEARINTLEDLFDHLDAHWHDGDIEASKRSLSRRVYKDTECGAWATFGMPGERAVSHESQTWTGRYAKIDGVWEMLAPLRDGVPCEASTMPQAAKEYFWPSTVQSDLNELADGAASLTLTETIRVPVMAPHAGSFVVGSIVEGSDAEVPPETVFLPCSPEDIDRAIAGVNDEACRLWDEANGEDGEDGEFDGAGEES